MNKIILFLAACSTIVSGAFLTGCSPKVYTTQTAAAVPEASYVPFTNSLKQRMEHDNIDIKKVQFYIDQPLVLRSTSGMEKGYVAGGAVAFNNEQSVNEIAIPAFTPGVCEKVSGDSLYISFDAPGKTIVFA